MKTQNKKYTMQINQRKTTEVKKKSLEPVFDALSLNPDSYVLIFHLRFYSRIYICQKWQVTQYVRSP